MWFSSTDVSKQVEAITSFQNGEHMVPHTAVQTHRREKFKLFSCTKFSTTIPHFQKQTSNKNDPLQSSVRHWLMQQITINRREKSHHFLLQQRIETEFVSVGYSVWEWSFGLGSMCSDNKRHHGAQALKEIKRNPRQACALQMFMACLAFTRIFTLLCTSPYSIWNGWYKSALSEESLMACDKSRVSNHYLLPLLKFSAPPMPLSLMLGWHSQRCSKSTSMDSRWLEWILAGGILSRSH